MTKAAGAGRTTSTQRSPDLGGYAPRLRPQAPSASSTNDRTCSGSSGVIFASLSPNPTDLYLLGLRFYRVITVWINQCRRYNSAEVIGGMAGGRSSLSTPRRVSNIKCAPCWASIRAIRDIVGASYLSDERRNPFAWKALRRPRPTSTSH